MATDFTEQLRNATFPVARRGGYSPEAVDAYLSQLADWLDTGGADQARAAVVQREMERVGERTGSILSAAQESADRITAEAQAEAARLRADAERESAEARSAAEAYAAETRSAADAYAADVRERAEREAREVAENAAREAAESRAGAEEQARTTIRNADSRLERAEREAADLKRAAEAELGDLVGKRREVIANVEELATGLRAVVDGPGSAELELPEDVGSAEVTVRRAAGSHAAREHRILDPLADGRERAETPAEPHGTSYEPPSDEPTAPTESVPEDEDEELDTEEQEIRRRRRASVDSAEGPTEETKLTELL